MSSRVGSAFRVSNAFTFSAIFLVACSHAALAQVGGSVIIPNSGWRVHAVDSEERSTGHAATNAFDGDTKTLWSTAWVDSSPTPPHDLQIDLGAVYAMTGFRYTPRQDGNSNGRIGKYEFYVSADGSNWGAAAASGTFSNSSSEQSVTFAVRSGRYIRLRALSEANGRPWTTVAELAVVGSAAAPEPAVGAIARTSWSLHHVDSEERHDYPANHAFDGNPATIWSTEWRAGSPPPPHEIQINLGSIYDVTGFRYLPRQDGNANGRIGRYEFYVSVDGNTWGTAVASGTFANTSAEQQATFQAKRGQYIRLRALSEAGGRPWTTVAELNVLGRYAGTNRAPVVSLSHGGGSYVAPASVTLTAAASDADGTVTRVDFYAGSALIHSDTTAPFTHTLTNVAAGSYPFTAVARDNAGNTSQSNVVTVAVGNTAIPKRVVFSPAPNHAAVDGYVLYVFRAGTQPGAGTAVASANLGKPAVVNGDCSVDASQLFASLAPGQYIAAVASSRNGNLLLSAPSQPFVR